MKISNKSSEHLDGMKSIGASTRRLPKNLLACLSSLLLALSLSSTLFAQENPRSAVLSNSAHETQASTNFEACRDSPACQMALNKEVFRRLQEVGYPYNYGKTFRQGCEGTEISRDAGDLLIRIGGATNCLGRGLATSS